MYKVCEKCKTKSTDGFSFAYLLCTLCDSIVESTGKSGMLEDFMKLNGSSNEDIPMGFVARNMLQAREKRANGEGPWRDWLENKNGYYSNWHEKVVY